MQRYRYVLSLGWGAFFVLVFEAVFGADNQLRTAVFIVEGFFLVFLLAETYRLLRK